jgi:hypothetical protein
VARERRLRPKRKEQFMRSTRVVLASVAALALSLGFAQSAFAGAFGDMAIARTVHFVGDEAINTTGAGQKLTQGGTRPGVTRYFALRVHNLTGGDNYWTIHGCDGNRKFKVRYFMEFTDHTFQNVTGQVIEGTQTTAITASGDFAYLEMQIKPTKKAKPGSRFECLVLKHSVPNAAVEADDAVKGVVKMKG